MAVPDGVWRWNIATSGGGFCSNASRWAKPSTRNIRGGLGGLWKRGCSRADQKDETVRLFNLALKRGISPGRVPGCVDAA